MSQPGAGADFVAEGLLKGLRGRARADRLALLEELHEAGVPLEELKRAVAEDRLALLPVERVFAGEALYTVRQVAELAGVGEELLLRVRGAAGLSLPGPDEVAWTEEDLEAASRIRFFLDAGLPEEQQVETVRIMGAAMANVAASLRTIIGSAFLQAGDTERQLGLRLAQVAEQMTPMVAPLLAYNLKLHLQEGVRRDAVSQAERETGELAGADDVTVAFADMVGFTRLGESLPAADIGHLAGRLAELAGDVARPPVRLVKTIGDAAMLVSDDPAALISAVLDLIDAAESEGEDFPQLRAGAAHGQALTRWGDWYGRPVNLASRITGAARPGTVLATSDLRRAAGDGFAWSRAPALQFKGIEGRIGLWRVRRSLD